MKFDSIHDQELRAQFERINDMKDHELQALGLHPVIRDRLLAGIIVPDHVDTCWLWSKAHLGKGVKARPLIHFRGQVLLAYRVLMALLLRKHVDLELCWVLHKCPGGENCRCLSPHHLKEATSKAIAAKENAQDRSNYGTMSGDNNPSRKRPETRPRGTRHPKSQFRGAGGVRMIQIFRATYDRAENKRGLIEALVRWSREQGHLVSRCAVTNVVLRKCYNDIPDDPPAALSPTQFTVNLPGDSAKRRKNWPEGDTHKHARMPVAAKRAFVTLYHRTPKRAQKRLLMEYVAVRYHIACATARSLSYGDPARFGAAAKSEIKKLPKIDFTTPELLHMTFASIPALRRKEGEA